MFDFEATVNRTVIDTFGRDVTFRPIASAPGNAAFVRKAIFDRNHTVVLEDLRASEEDGPGHSTTMPVLSIRLSDFETAPGQGDEAEIGLERFYIWDVHPDGEGMADLVLRKLVV